VTAQLASIRGLLQKLEQIHSYLTKVVNGKMPSNHQVMYHLQDALSLVPDLIPLTKSFHMETHDQEHSQKYQESASFLSFKIWKRNEKMVLNLKFKKINYCIRKTILIWME
jgi:hypothetical protein